MAAMGGGVKFALAFMLFLSGGYALWQLKD